MSITYKIFPRKIPQKYINFNLHSNNNFTDKKKLFIPSYTKNRKKIPQYHSSTKLHYLLVQIFSAKKGTILGKTNDSKNSFN